MGSDNMVTLTALAKNHLGQDHALIRFRKKGDRLVPDFTLVDEYMTRYLEHCAPPRSLILYMWDRREKGIKKVKLPSGVRRDKSYVRGMEVSVIGADGKLSFGESPPFGAAPLSERKRISVFSSAPACRKTSSIRPTPRSTLDI